MSITDDEIDETPSDSGNDPSSEGESGPQSDDTGRVIIKGLKKIKPFIKPPTEE